VEFQILGPLRVVDDGRDLTPARLKQRALLALLLVRREEVVPGSVLIEALWGEEPPGTAQTALYGHVSVLRKLLGQERIRTRPPGYLLRAAAGEIDLTRFESLLAAARQGADPAERSARLAEALALWRGEPLADLRYESFAQPEIVRLQELRLGALEDRIDADLALGRHAELVAELEPLVAEHGARERLRGQLMLALYRCGRQADALHAFQRGRHALVEELGIEPGPALQQLERKILNQDPALELEAPAAPAPPAVGAALPEVRRVATTSAALIGRERERGVLDDRLDRAAAGEGGVFLLAGEAGVGKTSLAQAALGECALLVLRCACSEQGRAPYAPLIAALRAYDRIASGALAESGRLTSHLAVLLPELGPAPAVVDHLSLAQALRDAFAGIARHQPAVVFLDDLQWGDEATLELLPSLASSVAGPLLFLAVYRSDEIPRAHPLRRTRAELRRGARLDELMLEPLDQGHAAKLASRILGRSPGPRLAQRIFERTEGVPLFVEELAAALSAGRRLEEQGDALELPAGHEVPLPDTVRETVLLRTDRLTQAGRHALEVAAVAGARVDLGLVADLAGVPGLEEAIEQGFLVEVEEGRAAFRHALVREAVYAEIPWTRRRVQHRRLAEILERAGAQPQLLAEHWLAASEPERARPKLLAAAEAFCAVHAYRDASRLGRRALELWPEGEDEAGRLVALERLGLCAKLSGELAEAARVWEEVVDTRRAGGDSEALGEAERRLAAVYELAGAWERAGAARTRSAEAFAACGLPAEAATERLTAAAHLQAAGWLSAALELVTRSSKDVELAARGELRARALALEGQVRAKLGEGETGVALVRSALALALAENAAPAVADAYFRLGSALEHAAAYPAAIDAYATAYDYCQREGVEGPGDVCFACLTPIMVHTGEWQRATEVCREVLEGETAPPLARMVASGELGHVYALRGEPGRARRLLAEALAFARQNAIFGLEIEATHALARVDGLVAKDDEAAERMRELIARWQTREERHYSVAALRWATTLFARRGDVPGAGSCADALARIAAATGDTEAVAALAHALGELALLNGDADGAARQFTRALELLIDASAPYERAETQVRAAVALAAAGERQTAVDRLTDAYRTARKLGARPLASSAAEELQALGEPVEGRSAGLSRREVEVLRFAAEGLTNREIAARLFLSKRTVDMHVRNLLAKLGCRSRVEAAQRARSLELIE
jgi:DNA-binding SARP family transcriptional activator